MFNLNESSTFSICNNNSCLKVDYTNTRFVLNKVEFLEKYIYIKNGDLQFLTETWLTPKVSDATVCPSDYNIIRNDRLNRREGLDVGD